MIAAASASTKDGDGRRGVSSWPREAMRMSADGKILEGKLCMASRQYLEEALRRLMPSFRDGVGWMMVDGNWYPGECFNPAHGHPVPFTVEDHWRANMELIQRIHRAYPKVYIEFHDPVTWALERYSPINYGYGLPFSHNENWAFEMMWHPLEEIKSGRAAILYNYNLACNIPLYVTVCLDNDNEHCLALWWFASTCRHLGLGGVFRDPLISAAQKNAMVLYDKLSRYFKRGRFYGFGESVHLHVLPEENSFVVNLFNLSAETRQLHTEVSPAQIGLDVNRYYTGYGLMDVDPKKGVFIIDRTMEPWSTEVFESRALPS